MVILLKRGRKMRTKAHSLADNLLRVNIGNDCDGFCFEVKREQVISLLEQARVVVIEITQNTS